MILLFMANKLTAGNHWVNIGMAHSRHEDTGEKAQLWVMETGHQPAGGRVTGEPDKGKQKCTTRSKER